VNILLKTLLKKQFQAVKTNNVTTVSILSIFKHEKSLNINHILTSVSISVLPRIRTPCRQHASGRISARTFKAVVHLAPEVERAENLKRAPSCSSTGCSREAIPHLHGQYQPNCQCRPSGPRILHVLQTQRVSELLGRNQWKVTCEHTVTAHSRSLANGES
jgi:hypothetical protein